MTSASSSSKNHLTTGLQLTKPGPARRDEPIGQSIVLDARKIVERLACRLCRNTVRNAARARQRFDELLDRVALGIRFDFVEFTCQFQSCEADVGNWCDVGACVHVCEEPGSKPIPANRLVIARQSKSAPLTFLRTLLFRKSLPPLRHQTREEHWCRAPLARVFTALS